MFFGVNKQKNKIIKKDHQVRKSGKSGAGTKPVNWNSGKWPLGKLEFGEIEYRENDH